MRLSEPSFFLVKIFLLCLHHPRDEPNFSQPCLLLKCSSGLSSSIVEWASPFKLILCIHLISFVNLMLDSCVSSLC